MKGLGERWHDALEDDEDDLTPGEQLAWRLIWIVAAILASALFAGVVK